MRRHIRKNFTLPEVVAVILIIGLLAGIAVPMLRDPSPARKMEKTVLDFETFCARVRYQAAENGADRAVCFDPETKSFRMTLPSQTEQADGPSLTWKLPDDFELAGDTLPPDSGEQLELFRFFPDGGASGTRELVFRCGKTAKRITISMLTGLLTIRDAEEGEI